MGLSCHYRGDEIMFAAVAAGANIIEKGVVDNPDKAEQDLVSALDIRDLSKIALKIRNCYDAMGKDTWKIVEPRDKVSWKGMIAKTDHRNRRRIFVNKYWFCLPTQRNFSR